MERLPKACGGYPVNALDELKPDCLGFAKSVYEHVLGDEKYTFIEGCKNPTSCTIMNKAPHDHIIAQLKDAVRDGLRAVANILEDKSLVPGAGAFEAACSVHLRQMQSSVSPEEKAGLLTFANALEVIPRTLALNAGLDPYHVVESLRAQAGTQRVGLDIDTGKLILPEKQGIIDSYRVKRQFLHLGTLIAMKLLMVDEILSAGKKMTGEKPAE